MDPETRIFVLECKQQLERLQCLVSPQSGGGSSPLLIDALLAQLKRERDRRTAMARAFGSGTEAVKALQMNLRDAMEELQTKDEIIVDLSLRVSELETREFSEELYDHANDGGEPDGGAMCRLRCPELLLSDMSENAPAKSPSSSTRLTGSTPEQRSDLNAREIGNELLANLSKKLHLEKVYTALLKDQITKLGEEPVELQEASCDENDWPMEFESVVDTSEIVVLLDCKDAELRVVHQRLHEQEIAFQDVVHELEAWQNYCVRLREIVEECGHSPPTFVCPTNATSNTADMEGIPGVRTARTQLDALLGVLKMIRKQNGVLHGLLVDRGAKARMYSWLLFRHRHMHIDDSESMDPLSVALNATAASLLPGGAQLRHYYNDPSQLIKLAFAERDEEIHLKDRALMERSSELLVLEESLSALHTQLTSAKITPCRPLTHFASQTLRAQQEAQQLVIAKQASRTQLEERVRLINLDLETITSELKVLEIQLEQEEEDVCEPHHREEQKKKIASLINEIVALRSKRETVYAARQVAEAQCAANQNEVDLLRKVIQNSTRALVEMQAQKDLHIGLDVVDMLKRRFLS